MKICGLTRAQDIALARDLGAWALGFVFASSPRRLAAATAGALIDQVARESSGGEDATRRGEAAGMPGPLTVGVFGDASAEEIARVVEQVGLDAVQLHGESEPGARAVKKALSGWESPLRLAGGSMGLGPADEDPEFARWAKAFRSEAGANGVLVIQAVGVAAEESDSGSIWQRVERARMDADMVLLDTRTKGRLGGTGVAFRWELARESAVDQPLLVAGGIGPRNVVSALERSAAWGVDVSSGVEASPGIKDGPLMRKLFSEIAGTAGCAGKTRDVEEKRVKGP